MEEDFIYSYDEYSFAHANADMWQEISDCIDNGYKGNTLTIYRGVKGEVFASEFIDAESIIDSIEDEAWEEFGELSNDFLTKISKEETAMLDTLLSVAIDTWANKYSKQPAFFRIDKVQECEVELVFDNDDFKSFNITSDFK
jgi:hypothetical protein